MYSVTQEKWEQFPASVQMQHIAVELARASKAAVCGEHERAHGAHERALALIDASIADDKHTEKRTLYELRDAVASLYAGEDTAAVSRALAGYLLQLGNVNNAQLLNSNASIRD